MSSVNQNRELRVNKGNPLANISKNDIKVMRPLISFPKHKISSSKALPRMGTKASLGIMDRSPNKTNPGRHQAGSKTSSKKAFLPGS
jgi:hypothetical protein